LAPDSTRDTGSTGAAGALAPGEETPGGGWRARLAGGRLEPLLRWESALVLALVGVILLGNSISPQFHSSYNLFTGQTGIGDLAIMALPMTLIVITGEIDLSVASTLALSAELLGALWIHHWPLGLIFVVCLATGAACGFVNGFLVTRLGLPSLAVTIGTLTLYRGLANVVLGSTSVSTFPTFWTGAGVTGAFGTTWLAWSMVFFVVLAVITGVVLKWTSLGRSLYAIGLNEEAAFHSGIRVKRIKMSLYVVSGIVCAAVGILYAFELSSAAENIGIGFELQVVTIVLLGGVSIFGGKGSIFGVFLAALVYAGLRSGLLLTSSFTENDFQIVSGGLLVLSVLVPNAAAFTQRGSELLGRRRRARGGLTGAAPAPGGGDD
jgi:rhamnose transport system permease protein